MTTDTPRRITIANLEAATGETKQCRRCGERRPIGSFYRHSGHRDGLQSACKPCTLTANRERGGRQPRVNLIDRLDSFAVLHLNHDKSTLVDLADLHRVEDIYWVAQWDGHNWYAKNFYQIDGKATSRFLHRIVLDLPKGKPWVDHINGNPLDNRRGNLRIATFSENAQNRRRSVLSSTGFKGVTFEAGRYRARIRVNGPKISIGTFKTPEQAARAYDAKAREVFGEFARCNFREVSL